MIVSRKDPPVPVLDRDSIFIKYRSYERASSVSRSRMTLSFSAMCARLLDRLF